MSRDEVMQGTDNVFADLGVANPDEALAKAEMARRITNLIRGKGLTQARAAEILGIDQPKVSLILRGRLTGFSTGRLIRFLNLLGQDVEIVVRAKPRSRSCGRIKVMAGV